MKTKNKNKLLFALIGIIACITLIFSMAFAPAKGVKADELSAEPLSVEAMSINIDIADTDLGRGINVLTAETVNTYKNSYVIDDISKIEIGSVSLKKRSTKDFSSENVQDLMGGYNYSCGVDGEIATLFGVLKSDIENNGYAKYKNYRYRFYNIFKYYYNSYKVNMVNPFSKLTYENNYSSAFLLDLNSLANGSMTIDRFFTIYGTHIVSAAIYGGRVDAAYTVFSNTINFNAENKEKIKSSLNFENLSETLEADILAKLNTGSDITYSYSDFITAFYSNSVGGINFSSRTYKEFNDNFKTWINSINDDSNTVVVDYESDSLIPIWDILPDGYSGVADKLKQRFIELYDVASSDFINEYKSAIFVDEGDYRNFSGGKGTASEPYLITKPEQMLNIEKVNMSAHYKLKNDIDLSVYEWNAIGGHYKKRPFTGTFDGAEHTISGLRRTTDIAESDHRIYFGLFGYVGTGGVVKNINFTNLNINMTGPEKNDENTKVFVGVVSGALYGNVYNIKVKSGVCSYDICTNGVSYVGAITGLAHFATIENCSNNVDVTSGRYTSGAGGIVGYSYGTKFTNCSNTATINARCTGWGGTARAGGITGECSSRAKNTYSNCTNTGKLNPKYYSWGVGCNYKKGDLEAAQTDSNYE